MVRGLLEQSNKHIFTKGFIYLLSMVGGPEKGPKWLWIEPKVAL